METPIPVHFAFLEGTHVDASSADRIQRPLRDIFDVPDLNATDDEIANGTFEPIPGGPLPAGAIHRAARRLFTASADRITRRPVPQHFQNFVLFTNYQFYIDEFCVHARDLMANGGGDYTAFIEPGNVVTHVGDTAPQRRRLAAAHAADAGLSSGKAGRSSGITMVNIGVGPSNAKTITDHIAVLRPHAWMMLGHCAGLRNSQALGDYVLAHAYVREDHVLDDDLPVWVPVPALAEVQVALEQAVARGHRA